MPPRDQHPGDTPRNLANHARTASASAIAIVAALTIAAPNPAQAQVTPADMLNNVKPFAKDVDFDTPTDPDEIAACKVEPIRDGKSTGFLLRDARGRILRRFADTNGDRQMDLWSYYKDGFEVYRERDVNFDRALDECQWMNANGTRVALVSRGKIVGWRRLSPEELSRVLVVAIAKNDDDLYNSLFATPDELRSLGVPAPEIDRLAAETPERPKQRAALRAALAGWDDNTAWLRFDGTMPRAIPADAAPDLADDVVLYENAVVFAGPADGSDSSRVAYLQVPEIVKIGEVWKITDHPRPIDPNQERVQIAARNVGVRAAIYSEAASATAVAGVPSDPRAEAALRKLAEFDTESVDKLPDMTPAERAEYYSRRIALIRALVNAIPPGNDRLIYERQIVDSLAAAYQEGARESADELAKLADAGGPLASYAAFRKILADYALESEEPGSNLLEVQRQLSKDLERFVNDFPKAPETPEALLQLGNVGEYNFDEDAARAAYQRLARDFPDSEPGRKAAGALKRLELVGNDLDFAAADIQNRQITSAALKGRPYVVVFWASWAEQSRRDLPEIAKVAAKHQDKGLRVVAVNLDNDRAALDAVLAEEKLPWFHIHEAGGLERSPLAEKYGVMSLPLMFLVAPDGKVVHRNLRLAIELEKQMERLAGAASNSPAPPNTPVGLNAGAPGATPANPR